MPLTVTEYEKKVCTIMSKPPQLKYSHTKKHGKKGL